MRLSQLIVCASTAVNIAGAQDKPPQPLPVVPVTAEAELVRNAKLREFDRRRSKGFGKFLTEADLVNDQYRKLGDVLMKLPGLTTVGAKRMPGYGASAAFLVSSRGSATITHVSPVFGRNCPIAIWLDGVPVYKGLDRAAAPAFGTGNAASLSGQVFEPPFDINSIMTMHVAAIEFYAGPATMPAELNSTQGTCGALVVWTK